MNLIKRHYAFLTDEQLELYRRLCELHQRYNSTLNLISRKSLDNFKIVHVLHSLSIVKVLAMKPEDSIVDIGTGGGFPGLVLAIAYPETNFLLVDATYKKIATVRKIIKELEIHNVQADWNRVENMNVMQFDAAIGRAVAPLPKLLQSVQDLPKQGLWYLMGPESHLLPQYKIRRYALMGWYDMPFFDNKFIVHATKRDQAASRVAPPIE